MSILLRLQTGSEAARLGMFSDLWQRRDRGFSQQISLRALQPTVQ